MEGLEIFEHNGKDYSALTQFGGWIVAIMNCSEKRCGESLRYIERHMLCGKVLVVENADTSSHNSEYKYFK